MAARSLGTAIVAGAAALVSCGFAFSFVPTRQPSSSPAWNASVEARGLHAEAADGASSAGATILARASGIALLVGAAVVAGKRRRRVAMRSKSPGNVGQLYFPKLKGQRKENAKNPPCPPWMSKAQRLPPRYELYDIQEELDETTPIYTVISEPREPKTVVNRFGPLLERYPWAGKIKTCQKKQDMEYDPETALEPLFGNPYTELPKARGQKQQFIHRKGFGEPGIQPTWINKPPAGSEEWWAPKPGSKNGGHLRFGKWRGSVFKEQLEAEMDRREALEDEDFEIEEQAALAEGADEADDALGALEG